MGFGASKQVVITAAQENVARLSAILFSKEDAESVLRFEPVGTYLLYRDHESDRMYLSVRSQNYVEHHRVNFEDNLYYMDNQPYPYLDSIIRYHQRHKLNGTRLKHQAHLSARTVKLFTTKITAQNGNVPLDRKSKSESDITDNNNIVGIEHKNDRFVGKSRISKSSGRLWISGVHKSLKRISAPERGMHFSGSGVYHRETRPNTFTENGYKPYIDDGDDLDDIIEDLQDFHQSLNSSPRTGTSSPPTESSTPRIEDSFPRTENLSQRIEDLSLQTENSYQMINRTDNNRTASQIKGRESDILTKHSVAEGDIENNPSSSERSYHRVDTNNDPVILYCSHL